MARFLLDTNIASFFLKRTYPSLNHRLQRLPAELFCISAITEAEMRRGMELMPNEARLRKLLPEFLRETETAPWDSLCAQRYALLSVQQERSSKPLSNFDTMIAAHALAHDFTLVTHDRAFARVKGLRLEDWTKGPQRA